MSNIFQEVLNDVQQVENNLLGPSYPYYQQIKPPGALNMSNAGTKTAISNNIAGLGAYIDTLLSGTGPATWVNQPLGNKFFMQTGAQCMDVETNQEVTRSIYLNNVPTGNINIDIGSDGIGGSDGGFNGLIPGAIDDLNVLNPYSLMQAFLTPNPAQCQAITLETIDSTGTVGQGTAYLTNIDIQNMNACEFLPDGSGKSVNPITGAVCTEGFTQRKNKKQIALPKDPVAQIYFAGLACVGIYVFYKIMQRSN
jgi:hypothetical protein